MVAIFTGLGAGFERGSGSVLGSPGLLGSGSLGRNKEQVLLNAATGNLMISQQDEFLVGLGPDSAIGRTYNSIESVSDGDNGDHWRQSTTRTVHGLTGTLNTAGSTIKRTSGDGSDITYSWNAAISAYVATDGAGAHDKLVNASGVWTWTDGNTRSTETYSAYGTDNWRITQAANVMGLALTFTYTGANLTQVTTQDGSYEQYSWTGSNITQIVTGYTDLVTSTAKTLTRTRYGYDTSNRLTSVTIDLTPEDNLANDGATYITSYAYDGTSKRVASISETDGSSLAIHYDSSGRVDTLTQTVASGVTRVTGIAYGAGSTTITDSLNQTTTLEYNSDGLLTKITSPPAYSGAPPQVVQFGYTVEDGVILSSSITDALGVVSAFTYDSSGNLMSSEDGLGNIVSRSYGSRNEMLTETRRGSDANGASVDHTTRYIYNDIVGNLSFGSLAYSVDPEGRVTYYTHSSGRLVKTSLINDVIYDVSSLGTSESIPNAQMNSWFQAITDKTNWSNSNDIPDPRGNTKSIRTFSAGTVTGNATPDLTAPYTYTNYTYDQAGQLLSRTTNGFGTETFVYDGLGRITASTDLNGGTTNIVFYDSAMTTVVTLANGLTQTSVYNQAGELVSFTETGSNVTGGTAYYAYDKRGQLRVTTDATGHKSYIVYDKIGRKIADVDHYGNLIEYRYDADNRLVATIRYTNDVASQLANLANVDYNFEMSNLRPAATSTDLWTWNVYDADSRVIETIDGAGDVTTYQYDASSRLIGTIRYANNLTSTQINNIKTTLPTSAVLPTADSAHDSIARNFYDKAGLLIGVLNGEGYLSRIVYDNIGRKVTEIAYATITDSSLRAAGTLNALVNSVITVPNPADRTTRYVYDGQSHLRFQIDALNHVTEYIYDAGIAGQASVLRETIQYAGTISALSDYKLATVKTAIAALASNTDNRKSWAVYDTSNRLAFSIDAMGAVTRFVYDTMGRVTRTVQFSTFRATTTLPTYGDMTSWADATGTGTDRITRTYYTERGEVRYSVDPEGYVTWHDYDAEGREITTRRWDTPIATTDSTTMANVAALATGAFITTSTAYDNDGRVDTTTDGEGVVTRYVYNHNGTLESIYRADNYAADKVQTKYGYDNAGRKTAQYDAYGTAEQATTYFAYDGLGNVVTVTDPRVNSTYSYYDRLGRVVSTRDAENYVTETTYNAFNEAVSVTRRSNRATNAASASTAPVYIPDAAHDATTYSYYNVLGQVSVTRDADDYVTEYSYTTFGEISSTTRHANKANNTASATALPTFGISTDDATTGFLYDKAGRVLKSTDALTNFESYGYNRFDRISVTNKVSGVTNYVYDRLGRLSRQGYAATTTNYQASGNYSGGTLVTGTTTTGVENVTTYGYDSRGNVKQQIEGYATTLGGAVTALRTTNYDTYDANNRPTLVTHDAVTVIADDMVTVSSTTPSEQYSYDKRGNVVRVIDAGGAATYSYYDHLDQKVAEIRQLAASQWVYTAYGYDADSNLTSTKVYDANGSATTPPLGGTKPAPPSGTYRETGASFDALNRMQTSFVVSVAGNTFTTGSWNGTSYATSTASLTTFYEYDAGGNVVKVTAANGAVVWSWYNRLNQKSAQLDAEGYLTTWTYNSEGNVGNETRFATKFTGTPTLGTAASVAASGDDRTTTFRYDLNGNRTRETRTGVVAWTIDASGVLTAAATDSIINYTYTALGQVWTKSEPTETGAIATYSYDSAGRLTSEQHASFSDANGTTVTPVTAYAYDAVGDLVTSTRAGTSSGTYQALQRVTTNRYGEGGRLLSTTDAEGNVHRYFYDVMGRIKKDAYNRTIDVDALATTTATTTVAEAQTTTYDLDGRTLTQAIYSTISGTFQRVGYFSFQYNNYGQITGQGTGSNSASGMNAGSALMQVTNQYDSAGHLTGTNSGDGIWKFYGYDALGNQTLAISSAGASFTSATGFAGALALVGNANVNGTYTVYDKRNLATQVIEEGRDLSATVTNQTLNTYRVYNAFGDVANETNARGATMTYTYNTMGRKIRSESPAVSITLENGLDIWVKPSEDNYYDLAGRQIGSRDANGTYGTTANTQATAYTKAANTGNLISYALLAGTGYDKSQALVMAEFHADSGKKEVLYDIMGDARVIRDELYNSASPFMHVEENSYNRLGQLVQVKHNRVTNVSSASDDTTRLIDTYVYDQFGQRIQHGNSVYSTQFEKSAYDALGRVTSKTDLSGYVTTTAYVWDGTLSTSLNGTAINFGGWAQTTTYANNRTAISKQDIYNREVYNKDLGNHELNTTFDAAGRMITRNNASTLYVHNIYSWYNNGAVETATSETGTIGGDFHERKISTYGYDATGNRTSEVTTSDGTRLFHYVDYYGSHNNFVPYDETLVNETTTYDALGRLTSMNATATTYLPTASITEKYDAVGNIRNTTSTHALLDALGAVSSTVTDSYWFRYNSRNQLATDKGILSGAAGAIGTTIVRGNSSGSVAAGQDYLYDAVGQRVAAIRTDNTPGTGYFQEIRENDEYDGAGRVADIKITQGTGAYGTYNASTGQYAPPSSLPSAPAATSSTPVSSIFTYDLLGRQTAQSDYSGSTVTYSRTANYTYNGFLLSDTTDTVKYEQNGTTNTYRSENIYSEIGYYNEYLLGAVGSVNTVNKKNGSVQNNSSTANDYFWWNSALQHTIIYQPDTSKTDKTITIFGYDYRGTLNTVHVSDGSRRDVRYVTNGDDQVIRRDEVGTDNNGFPVEGFNTPHEIWYRFGGKELGYVSNNGTSKLTESASIYDRQAYRANSSFRNGTVWNYSDFAQSSDGPINSYNQGSSGGGYTVQHSGETLRSVAQQTWGDSSLWYKIAEANGMTGDTQLVEGQHLTLPAGVARNHHNAGTLTPYDSNFTTGNVSPTTPRPPQQKEGCGVLGQILLMAIAIAITIALKVPITNLIAGQTAAATAASTGIAIGGSAGVLGSAAAAMVGSVVSQGVGIATELQDKFSWGAVAMAGIGAGVGAAFGSVNFHLGNFANDVVRGALAGAVTQGIGVATRLQDKFSWTGVAAAGIGSGIGNAVGRSFSGGFFSHGIGNDFVTTAATDIADAATRSAIDGSNFGDNILAALPDAIGSVLGRALGGALAGSGGGSNGGTSDPRQVDTPTPADQVNDRPSASVSKTTGDNTADIVVTGYSYRADRLASTSLMDFGRQSFGAPKNAGFTFGAAMSDGVYRTIGGQPVDQFGNPTVGPTFQDTGAIALAPRFVGMRLGDLIAGGFESLGPYAAVFARFSVFGTLLLLSGDTPQPHVQVLPFGKDLQLQIRGPDPYSATGGDIGDPGTTAQFYKLSEEPAFFGLTTDTVARPLSTRVSVVNGELVYDSAALQKEYGKALPMALVATAAVAQRLLTCETIGSWVPDNSSKVGSNAYNYQGFVTGHPGQDFRVAASFRASGVVTFDGCLNTSLGPLLQEAKGDQGAPLVKGWSMPGIIAQGQAQQAVIASLPGTRGLWSVQTATDSVLISSAFRSSFVMLPVINIPMPRTGR